MFQVHFRYFDSKRHVQTNEAIIAEASSLGDAVNWTIDFLAALGLSAQCMSIYRAWDGSFVVDAYDDENDGLFDCIIAKVTE